MLRDERLKVISKQAGKHYVLIMDKKLEILERLKSRVRLIEVKILTTAELMILTIELNLEMDEAVESTREKMQ